MSTKNVSLIGRAVWPAIGNIYTNVLFYYYRLEYLNNKLNCTEFLDKQIVRHVRLNITKHGGVHKKCPRRQSLGQGERAITT